MQITAKVNIPEQPAIFFFKQDFETDSLMNFITLIVSITTESNNCLNTINYC